MFEYPPRVARPTVPGVGEQPSGVGVERLVRGTIKVKHFFFRNSGIWVSVLVIATPTLMYWLTKGNLELTIGATTVALSLAYFMQRQKLDELRLFNELFSTFNKRYEELNEGLISIVNGDGVVMLSGLIESLGRPGGALRLSSTLAPASRSRSNSRNCW